MAMNIDLKNLNMSDIKDQITKLADKKTLTKIGIIFDAIVLFLIIYYAILNPMVNDRKAIYEDKLNKENEIVQFTEEISQYKARIEEIKPVFEQTSTLFHSKAEVEDLYHSLSKYASKNGLVISKLEKKKTKQLLKLKISQ